MQRKEKHHNFISSDWWKELRRAKLAWKRDCQACGNQRYLVVHHASYHNLYKAKKRDALKDTYVLCSNCHYSFHFRFCKKTKTDMTKETEQFIKIVRKEKEKWYKKTKNEAKELYNQFRQALHKET